MSLPAVDREWPSPTLTPENRAYFDAAAQGRLLIKRCDACERAHFYPRALCPHCFSERTRWVEAEGHGVIYTYSVLRLGTPVPYALAYVKLAEGVTMMTNIVDCDLDALAIGMPVRVVMKRTVDGIHVPMFTPIGT